MNLTKDTHVSSMRYFASRGHSMGGTWAFPYNHPWVGRKCLSTNNCRQAFALKPYASSKQCSRGEMFEFLHTFQPLYAYRIVQRGKVLKHSFCTGSTKPMLDIIHTPLHRGREKQHQRWGRENSSKS